MTPDTNEQPNLAGNADQVNAAAHQLTAQQQQGAEPVVADVKSLDAARALPEVDAQASGHPVAFEPGSIEAFKGEDRRTMAIVGFAGGLAQQEVPSHE